MIGAVGLVPCFDVFEQIPGLSREGPPSTYRVTEMGLFWAIDPDQQRQGYATEAAQALIDFAFQQLRVKRLIATTEYDNARLAGRDAQIGHDACQESPARSTVVAGGGYTRSSMQGHPSHG